MSLFYHHHLQSSFTYTNLHINSLNVSKSKNSKLYLKKRKGNLTLYTSFFKILFFVQMSYLFSGILVCLFVATTNNELRQMH